MICSSLNLDLFIIRLLGWDGLYLKLEEETGLRTRAGNSVCGVWTLFGDNFIREISSLYHPRLHETPW